MVAGRDLQKCQPQLLAQLSSFYNSMATNMNAKNNNEECIAHFEKSYRLAKMAYGDVNDKTVKLLMNLGSAYLKMKNYVQAIKFLEEGTVQKKQLNLKLKPENIITDTLKLCEAYKGLHNHQQCLKLYTELIAFTKQHMPNRLD